LTFLQWTWRRFSLSISRPIPHSLEESPAVQSIYFIYWYCLAQVSMNLSFPLANIVWASWNIYLMARTFLPKNGGVRRLKGEQPWLQMASGWKITQGCLLFYMMEWSQLLFTWLPIYTCTQERRGYRGDKIRVLFWAPISYISRLQRR
jgi:hypothetical protein